MLFSDIELRAGTVPRSIAGRASNSLQQKSIFRASYNEIEIIFQKLLEAKLLGFCLRKILPETEQILPLE
jgi:hypothetical protein